MVTGVVYLSTVAYPLFSLNAWWWFQARGVVYENKIVLLFWILYLAVLIGSILFGIFTAVFKRLYQEGFFSIIILAGVWVFLEYIRAKFLFGFTWGHLGYTTHGLLPMLQLAHYGGVYTLSFLIVLINIILFYAIHRPLQDIEGVEGRAKEILFFRSILKHWYPYGALFAVALMFLGGSFLLNKQDTELKGQMSVVVIQSGNNENSREDEEKTFRAIERSLANNPAIAVIPESSFSSVIINETTMEPLEPPFAMGVMYSQEKSIYTKLTELSRAHPDTSFVFGMETRVEKSHHSSIIALKDGKVESIYHKRKLFPFSERSVSWFPFKTFLPLVAGKKVGGLIIHGERISALICSESLFPELASDSDACFVVAIGNDGIFQSPLVSQYNHIIAKFLAIETEKYVVRGMKTGVSSIMDPHGREVMRSNSQNEEILYAEIFWK